MFHTGHAGEHAGTWHRVAGALGALLLLYYLVPLLVLIAAIEPRTALATIATPRVARAAVTSLLAASGSTVISVLFGIPLAYWLSRQSGPLASAVTAIVVLPLMLPPVVSGVLLLSVLGPGAPLGAALGQVGVSIPGTLGGTILAQAFVASPFVVITARAAFAGVERDLERTSLSLGESRRRTFRRITLPLAWPGLLAGIVLAFARSIGEFGATLMVAYYPKTLPVEIWDAFRALGLDAAIPVALVLVGLALGSIALLSVLGTSPWE
jgi:molybdate/tungstate transport system permease protein